MNDVSYMYDASSRIFAFRSQKKTELNSASTSEIPVKETILLTLQKLSVMFNASLLSGLFVVICFACSHAFVSLKCAIGIKQQINRGDFLVKSTNTLDELPSEAIAEESAILDKVGRTRNVPTDDFSVGELTIFVVDMSMPGVTARIKSLKSAIHTIQPKGKVAVIGCLHGDAKVFLEPTSSVLTAVRNLKTLSKSVMGNISKGMHLSLDMAEKSLRASECGHVSIAILADGKAHGLRAGPQCDSDIIPICDLELLEEAELMASKRDALIAAGYKLHTVVVDTETLDNDHEWSPEGARLAATSHASYYHTPNLDGRKLLDILMEVKYSID